MERLYINLGKKSYWINIGENLLGSILDYTGHADKWVIITDENVDRIYGTEVMKAFEGKEVFKYVIPPGESSKNIGTVTEIMSFMLDHQLTRKSKLIALGGGVVGDLAGFCASIYMRGMEWIQVPTTLLAQIDSSVGGKTGVNMPQAKNVVGTFSQPKAVVIDLNVLKTLSSRELISGIAEVIKYGVIYDYQFLNYVDENYRSILSLDEDVIKYVIKKCCEIKAYIVSKDEREDDLRKILNFGHTIGHALESITKYEDYTHGEAVIIGMYYEAKMALKMGLINNEYFEEIVKLLEKTNINLDINRFDKNILIDIMSNDKKNLKDKISFILPYEPGKVNELLLSKEEITWDKE